MPFQLRNPFKKKLCFVCNEKLGKNYGYIYFEASDCDEPQKVPVCTKCLDELEKCKVKKDEGQSVSE